jgi:hypothetical protein
MPDLDLFGEPIRSEPGYQSARSEGQDRMFGFPVTLPGQMALQAPEGPSDGPCTWCGSDSAVGTCPKSIRCPTCGQGPGSRCIRPSGHPCMELHADRVALAESM